MKLSEYARRKGVTYRTTQNHWYKGCESKHDRDINAAINIRNEGERIKIGLSSPELTHQESKSLDPHGMMKEM